MKPIPKLEPSKPGTVIYYVNWVKVQSFTNQFYRFNPRARFIAQVCNDVGMNSDPETVKAYTINTGRLEADYVAKQVENSGNPKGMFLEILEREAREQIRARLRARLLPFNDVTFDEGLSPYIGWNEETRQFVLDTDKLEKDNTTYMDEDRTKIWDRHRLIAALLSDFMGKVENNSEILEYFYVGKDGSILPTTGRYATYYPPTKKKEQQP